MNHRIVSWAKFCEWVQGKKVHAQRVAGRATELTFEDGSEAVFYSEFDVRFGEKSLEPPSVSIREAT